MAIFTHRDEDGDEIEFIGRTGGPNGELMASISSDRVRPYHTYLDRAAVTRLHAALGEWLFPAYAGTPDTSLLERMVRKAAEDAVSAVLPLAARPGAGHIDVDVDPEPRDVGHPEPTWDDKLWSRTDPFDPEGGGPCGELAKRGVRLDDPCRACGYTWSLHRAQPVCGCLRSGAPIGEQCPDCAHWHRPGTRCMKPSEVQAPKRLVGCECGHRWGLHGGAACHGQISGGRTCGCTRLTQADANRGIR